ncbi:hypothetical protein ILYODFUR_032506, partial [Ilyodon furcidens]
MEDMDAKPCHQNKCRNGQYCNLGNQEKCIICYEASSAESNGERVRVPDQCRPQKRADMDHQAPQSQMNYRVTRSVGRCYRKLGESKAQIKADQERQKLWQHREADRSHFTQQGNQLHSFITQTDGSLMLCSSRTESGVHIACEQTEGNSDQELMSVEEEQVLTDQVSSHVPQEKSKKKGNKESVSAEQQHVCPPNDIPPQFLPLTCNPMHDSQDPVRQNEAEKMVNAVNSTNVYFQPFSYSAGQAICRACENSENAHNELYEIYSLSDQVYEEICDVPASLLHSDGCSNEKEAVKQRTSCIQQLQSKIRDRHHHQKEAVGSRLHHYTQRSDGESESPEKDADFAQYSSTDSCDLGGDTEQPLAEVKQSLDSQNLGSKMKVKKLPLNDHPESTNQTCSNKNSKNTNQEDSVTHLAVNSSEWTLSIKNTKEKTDAISLVIKDIREAIEEVKTRTIRSPYTPDEPKEPVWVLRQDLSPKSENDLQLCPGDD